MVDTPSHIPSKCYFPQASLEYDMANFNAASSQQCSLSFATNSPLLPLKKPHFPGFRFCILCLFSYQFISYADGERRSVAQEVPDKAQDVSGIGKAKWETAAYRRHISSKY